MDEAIIQLQIKTEHQAEEIAALSKELYTQQKELERLRLQIADMKERFRELQDNSGGIKDIAEETPPPHY